jgi:hypothetical protein
MSAPPPDEPATGPAPQPSGAEYPGFAAVPRPPRVPWVNPARKTQLAGWAVVASVLLIAAGFGIGYAVAGSDDHHRRPGMMYPARHMPYDMHGRLRPAPNHYPMPRMSHGPLVGPTVTVTVTPSPASTS